MLAKIKTLVFTLFIFSFVLGQDTTQKIETGRVNDKAQQKKPYVIFISIDGFRNDFADLHQAKFLQSAKKNGVSAPYMIPSFPSLTFPNHYSLVTGLYPSHHGLLDNTIYNQQTNETYTMGNSKMVTDGKWYGGTPLWVLAEKQKMISASFYWVGSEAAIQDTRPTYYYKYNEKIPTPSRLQTVKNWLSLPEEIRPHLITFYFSEVDHEAHDQGPNGDRVYKKTQMVDSSINALQAMLAPLNLPINYIVVSDHGMTKVDTENSIPFPAAIDTNAFKVPWGDALIHLYAKDKSKIQSTYNELKKDTSFSVYTLDETPDYWHYKKADDRFNLAGNLIAVPHLPRVFNFSKRKVTPGKHGFDNHHPDMRATFIAWGPAFKKGVVMDAFENVNVYPLIAHILGLSYDEKSIDGKFKVFQSVLKK